MVSSESFPCSNEDEIEGIGGNDSTGAKKPFFVVDLEPRLNRPFALGADATRRRNREAEDPTDLGLRGLFVRDRDGVGGGLNDVWEEMWGFDLEEPGVRAELYDILLSEWVYARALEEDAVAVRASVEGGW